MASAACSSGKVSIWAGLSRINWYPLPSVLAAVLYFLEVNVGESKKRNYLIKPVMWVIAGTLVAFLSQFVYVLISGADMSMFGSSLTSDLLWYRLLPGATYTIGVLPGIILVSIPIIGMIIQWARTYGDLVHPVRHAGIIVALFIFLAGGLIVSAKIGGGGNLHNLDAFLVLLMVIGTYIFFDRGMTEDNVRETVYFEARDWLDQNCR